MAHYLITQNNNILGGIPVFAGTRVPVKTLFDYLKANHPLDDFLDDFPTVAGEHAQQVIEAAWRQVLGIQRRGGFYGVGLKSYAV